MKLHAIARRVTRVVLLAAALAPWAAAPALAEIVKCVAKDGLPLYQNFPCHIDSLGTMPSKAAVPVARPATPATPATTQTSSRPASGSPSSNGHPIQVASTLGTGASNEPAVGMTADEVRAKFGEPVDVLEDEPRSGRVSTWRYADGKVVQFDNKYRVLAVQR
jgi:hypothetical protein